MRRPCFILVLLVLLGFCLPLGIPAEDVPGTAYDESETPPYESTPPVSIVVHLGAALAARLAPDSIRPFALARVRDTDANRTADGRLSLALLCTLLC